MPLTNDRRLGDGEDAFPLLLLARERSGPISGLSPIREYGRGDCVVQVKISDRLWDGFASQLGRPRGVAGWVVGRMLNRGNHSTVAAAVAATGIGAGAVVADVGFGGGVGLQLLLDRVGGGGQVHGVEISPTMIGAARQRFRGDLGTGRLVLHEAAMDALPLSDASLDAVISTNTVYFIDDLAPAFAELARVLRPSGRAVLGVGDPATMTRMPVTRHRFRLRPVFEITDSLTGA
jgi:arsenite methyltransferase